MLDGKVAIVTGSAANIGRATALLFAKQGARVVINAKNNVDGGNAVVDEIKAAGGDAIFVQADLAQPEEVEKLFKATVDAFGTVDILVNNAGGGGGKPFMETTKADWLEVLDDNLMTTVLCS